MNTPSLVFWDSVQLWMCVRILCTLTCSYICPCLVRRSNRLGGATAYGLGSLSKTLCWTWVFRIFGIAGFVMLPVVLLTLRNPKKRSNDIVPESKKDDSAYTVLVRLLSLNDAVFLCYFMSLGAVRN